MGLQDSTLTQRKPTKDEEKGKTLDTHLFGEWHKKASVFAWTYSPYFNTAERVHVDTLINDDFPDYPFFKTDVGATFLGTAASAEQSFDYFKRKESDNLLFFTPYTDYIATRENLKFYNSKTPYSNLSYHTSGGKKIAEDDLVVSFSTNIKPEWSIGLYYQRYGTKGVYQNQKTEGRTFSIYTGYAGKRYSAHAGYIYNGIKNKENGGIQDDYYITDTVMEAQIIPVNLQTAYNKLRSNAYFLTQSYGVPLSIFRRNDTLKTGEGTMVYFGHSFQYIRQYRVYTDQTDDLTTAYYDNFFLDPTESRDSTFTSSLDNRLFIRLQPWSPTAIISTIDGGVGLEFSKYYGFTPDQYLSGATHSSYTNMYLYANASGMLSRYLSWNGFMQYYLSGYRQNDMLIDANARISFYPFSKQLNFTGRLVLDSKEADYYYKSYYGNHFRWANSFDKQTDTRIEVALSMPEYMFEVGLKQNLSDGFIYMDTTATPKQSSSAISVTTLYLQKNFKLGILRLDNRALFQLSSDEDILPLPKISFNARWYLEFPLVKSVLIAQLGVDCYFNTKYYLQAYNPATGMFHNQNEKKVGEYPMLDAFLNFKWKRATIFFKLANADKGMFNNEYFSALHYPRNGRMLRLGVSWHFYN